MLTLTVLLSIAMIFLFAQEVKHGVINGLTLCAEVIIPSMFIFAVVADFAAESGVASVISRPLSYIFSPLFKIPKNAAGAIIMSFLSGYPIGAAGVAKLYKRNEIDRDTATRMLFICINAAPPTVIVAIGGLLGSYTLGRIIYLSHILASLITGIVIARFAKMPKSNGTVKAKHKSVADSLVNATANACSQMLTVSGYVVLFSAISAVLSSKAPYLSAILEVTGGTAFMIKSGVAVPIIAGFIGFGGIAVICQVMSICKGIASPMELLFMRASNGVVTAAICALILKLNSYDVQTMSNLGAVNAQLGIVAAPVTVTMLIMSATFLSTLRQKN